MTVDECIDAYASLSDRVFQKQRRGLRISGRVQGRFDSAELERAIKKNCYRVKVGRGYASKRMPQTPSVKCE